MQYLEECIVSNKNYIDSVEQALIILNTKDFLKGFLKNGSLKLEKYVEKYVDKPCVEDKKKMIIKLPCHLQNLKL